MVDRNDEKLNKFSAEAKSIVLTESEKIAIRRNILAFMRENPLSAVEKGGRSGIWPVGFLRPRVSPFFRFAPAALIFVVVIGAGVSYAAEGSLPGDILYPVKTGINEGVESLLAVSSASKARVQAKLAEKRLEEAEKLLNRGGISPSVSEKVKIDFEGHLDRVSKKIEELESENSLEVAAEISSEFESSLRAHEKILLKMSEKKENGVKGIISKVREKKEGVSEKRINIEKEAAKGMGAKTRSAVEGKLKAIEKRIDEVKKFFERKKPEFGEDDIFNLQKRIGDAETEAEKAELRISDGAYGEAFTILQGVQRDLREIKLLMEARDDFEISVDFSKDHEDDKSRDGEKKRNDGDNNKEDDEGEPVRGERRSRGQGSEY